MFKAEIGDFLFIIIFTVVMLVSVLDKFKKAKRQQQPPTSTHPDDEFEAVEQTSPPKTFEEIMKQMMQTVETPEPDATVSYPEQAQSLEVIPTAGRHYYHPEEIRIREQSEKTAFSPPPMEEVKEELPEYEFDIRQAIIASEILNRKYG
jgi:hypothetical protein